MQRSGRQPARIFASLATAVMVATASPLAAQSYPVKPIKIIMPFPPGGTNDLVARAVADRLTTALKQPAIVDNRGGAGGMIGTDAVAKSAPDGYTLLVSNTGSLAAGLSLRAKLPYDVLKDFTPVSLLADVTIALALHPSVPAKNPRELIALAKARPGKLNSAVPGLGTLQHLVTEWFRLRANANVALVPYKGGAPALVELLAGQDDMAFINVPTVLEFFKAGRLRPLADGTVTVQRIALH